jgi:hypothetical protein
VTDELAARSWGRSLAPYPDQLGDVGIAATKARRSEETARSFLFLLGSFLRGSVALVFFLSQPEETQEPRSHGGRKKKRKRQVLVPRRLSAKAQTSRFAVVLA